MNFPLSLNFSRAFLISSVVAHPEGISPFSISMPFILLSRAALSMFCRISFNPGEGENVLFIKSIPAKGF